MLVAVTVADPAPTSGVAVTRCVLDLPAVPTQFLDMPRDRVRVVWMDGPQAYGRTAADDAGFEVDEAEVIYWGRCPECVAATAVVPSGG